MQETGRPTEQIEQIHAIMARSTTFVTLSGPSGLSVGILGLGGVWLIYRILGALWLTDEVFAALRDSPGLVRSVTGVLLGTLVAALTLAFLFAWLRARRYHDKLWNIASRRFAVHLGLPLLAGGVMLPALGRYGTFELAFPVMLVFFGLALISAGKYNFSGDRHIRPGRARAGAGGRVLGRGRINPVGGRVRHCARHIRSGHVSEV